MTMTVLASVCSDLFDLMPTVFFPGEAGRRGANATMVSLFTAALFIASSVTTLGSPQALSWLAPNHLQRFSLLVNAIVIAAQGLTPLIAYPPAGGFVAILLPFFSDAYLPPQRGTYDQIKGFHEHVVSRTNGRTPRFMCVRATVRT